MGLMALDTRANSYLQHVPASALIKDIQVLQESLEAYYALIMEILHHIGSLNYCNSQDLIRGEFT